MSNQLAICALGQNKPGLIENVTRVVAECGCSIADSRMTVLGDRFALMMLLKGSWDTIAKAENAFPKLGEREEITIAIQRAEPRTPQNDAMPYAIEVVSIDQAGVTHEITEFFLKRNINVEDLHCGGYTANRTGAHMFSLHMTIAVPAVISIAQLRGEFMDFCDQANLDAIMEPVK